MTLRVTLEIIPFGEEAAKYRIGELNIHNEGHELMGLAVYYGLLNAPDGSVKKFEGVEHYRQDGAWALVKKVLEVLKF